MTDIGADMDQLHSQIAVATRRLEMSVEQMKLRTSSQLSEIGKTSEAIGRLKGELAERTVAFAELQGKERAVSAQLLSTETELVVKTKELGEVEKVLAERKTELARFMAEFDVHPEIGKLRQFHAAEVDNLKSEKIQVEEKLHRSKEECLNLQCQLSVIEKQVEKTWASERMANAVLRERINDVASEVVRVATALEGLHSPIEAMVSAKLPTGAVRVEMAAGNSHNNSGQALNGHAVNGHASNGHGLGDSSGFLPENGNEPRTALAQRIFALRKRTLEIPAPG
jgi:chromosome segregation ATPase